jgi:hypothetical protein
MLALLITATIGLAGTLGGIYLLVRATEQWRLFELVLPSRVPPVARRVLGGMAGAVCVFFGVLFLCATFIR